MTFRRAPFAQSVALFAAASIFAACAGGTGGAATQPGPTLAPAATLASTVGPQATAAVNPSPAAGAIDACTLLTNDDIKEITGYPVAKVLPSPPDSIFPSACEWTVTGATWQIVLGVTPPGGSPTWEQLVPYMTGKTVTGIGDQAFQSDAAGDLFVRKGDTMFNIQYVAFGEPKDTQDRLAKRVVEHLP